MSTRAILSLFARAAVAVGTSAALALSPTPAPTGEATAVVHTAAKSNQLTDPSGCKTPDADSTHWYVEAYQCGQNFTEVSATATLPNPRPKTDGCNAEHSNGQITLEGSQGDQTNDIEVSWVSYPVEPDRIYLQVGRGVGSQKGGLDYPSSDWQPYPNKDHPNLPQPLAAADIPVHMDPTVDAISRADFDAAHLWQPVPSDISNKSAVKLRISYVKPASGESDGQWQVFVDDKEIGYYWDKKTFGPNGFQPRRAEWWGEVATTAPCSGSQDSASCTAMGNGKPGTYASATDFSNMATVPLSTDNSSRYMYVTNPDLYTSDKFDGHSGDSKPFSGTSFKYGGPGACAVPPISDPLATIGPQNLPKTPICDPGQDLVGGQCSNKGIPGLGTIPPKVIPPQTGTGFNPPNGGNPQRHCDDGQYLGRDGHCYNKPQQCDHDQYWDHGTCKPQPAECHHDQLADGHGGCTDKPQGGNECRSNQARGQDGKCSSQEKDCPHGQVRGAHGECSDIPNNGSQGSGSNDSCPNGMVRISPETDTSSGCAPGSNKQEIPQKQEQPQKQGRGDPQKEEHKDGHKQDNPQKQENSQKQEHPNKQEKKAEPNQQTNHKNPTQEKNNSGQSGSGKNDQKKKCDPDQEKCAQR